MNITAQQTLRGLRSEGLGVAVTGLGGQGVMCHVRVIIISTPYISTNHNTSMIVQLHMYSFRLFQVEL